jgi:hypothetical protein
MVGDWICKRYIISSTPKMGTKEIIFMNYDNLFIFVVTHVKQLGGKGRGVVITRKTTLEEITTKTVRDISQTLIKV